VAAVKYELGFYITADGILHRHRRENFKYYIQRIIEKDKFNYCLFKLMGQCGRKFEVKLNRQ
jgi:hypothetical protein